MITAPLRSITVRETLPESLLESVLTKLGIPHRLEPTLETLCAIYAAWCRHVPFDNVRKMIHVRSGNPAPLAGGDAEDFFQGWLRHGTGGTCWANAGATHALLSSLGFDSVRAIGTMLAAPNAPPNHGTVMVRLDGKSYLVDGSILSDEPLLLDETQDTAILHPAWGVSCSKRTGHWLVQWRSLHKVDGFTCRIESFGATQDEYLERYEQTRDWSPFNYQAYARVNRQHTVIGMAFGQAVSLLSDGRAVLKPMSPEERDSILIQDIGISEELVSQLPADTPTPPPPGSRTAAAAVHR